MKVASIPAGLLRRDIMSVMPALVSAVRRKNWLDARMGVWPLGATCIFTDAGMIRDYRVPSWSVMRNS